jgi:UDP-glucose 4-epimerase
MGAISATTETDVDLIVRENYRLSRNLWELCTSAGIPFIYASSAATYGDGTQGFDDDASLDALARLRPLNPYGWSKLVFDRFVSTQVADGKPTPPQHAGLRFFNVFGPRQDPKSPYSGVISIFCDRLARGEPIAIYGDGGQTRDFVNVADVVQALLAGLAQASTAAPVFNVCTGRPTSVLDLAETIASLCSTKLQVTHGPPRAGEIRHSLGDPGRARAALGLGAPVGLREGLAEVVDWLRAGRPGIAPAA